MALTNDQMVEKCQRGISACEKEIEKKQKTVDKANEAIDDATEQIELFHLVIEKIDGTPSPTSYKTSRIDSENTTLVSPNTVEGEDIGPL